MFKFQLASDIHAEFSDYKIDQVADTLILAGDILTTKWSGRHEFFKQFKDFKQVFYVMGNHEHYGSRFDKTKERLLSILPKNVTLLDNETVDHEGVLVFGATMWTSIQDLSQPEAQFLMNDYKLIKEKYSEKAYGKLRPSTTVMEHFRSRRLLEKVLEANKQRETLVITHHAPSVQSVNEKYAGSHMNSLFYSDLEYIMEDNPQISMWVHGHMHDPVDYQVNRTRVLANPRGYSRHDYSLSQENPNFNSERVYP